MARYSDELIEEIRSNNDIVDIISQYVILKRSGRSYFGLCPFHKEKSPSFSVSPDKQIFHCFGCGAGGNVFHFVSKIENINFIESVQTLADRAGIQLPSLDSGEDTKTQMLKSKVYEINEVAAQFYHENLYKPTSKLAQDYVKKRKLDNKTLKNFTIGYSCRYNELYQELKRKGFKEEEILASSLVIKNEDGSYVDRFRKRFMIPIRDVKDRVIAFGGRVLDDSKPKYINSPENIVYSKGRHLFGLNVAKRNPMDRLIIVEGYMDAISLQQRGIPNVVASLGTALTEAQGRLLRRYANKIIIGYDSDGAGQAATMRGLEILQNLGYDVRILQLDDPNVKDPDEYVLKNGSGRFYLCADKAISLVEFKVKMLKQSLNIQSASDKIKFLNEVSKILSKVDNNIEKEVYIENIAKEYNVSKEAIYAQTNKLQYSSSVGEKILEKKVTPKVVKKEEIAVSDAIIRRENTVIAILLTEGTKAYDKIKNTITIDEFKYEKNKEILKKLYCELEKGNSNVNSVLDTVTNEEELTHITKIMADDYNIQDIDKAIIDLINIYEKEKMINKRNTILSSLDNTGLSQEERASLERELSSIIIKLAKFK